MDQRIEGALDLVEAAFDLLGRRRERRGALVRASWQDAAGVPQDRLAAHGVGSGAPGGDDGLGLAGAEAVALDGVGEPSLLGMRERTKGVGDRCGEAAGIHAGGELGGELAGQGEAALGPCGASAEGAGDDQGRQVIVVGQRPHDTRLVHRAGGLTGRIGGEHPRLAGGADGVLDDAGDGRPSVLLPLGQPLEAVNHLERAVFVGGHAERERGELCVPVGVWTSKRRERGPQGGDGDFGHEAHERGSSTGRSW